MKRYCAFDVGESEAVDNLLVRMFGQGCAWDRPPTRTRPSHNYDIRSDDE